MSSQLEVRTQKASPWSWLEPDLSALVLYCVIGLSGHFQSHPSLSRPWGDHRAIQPILIGSFATETVDPDQSGLSGCRYRSKWLLRLGTAVPARARRPWSNRVSSGGFDLGRFRLLVCPAYRNAAMSAGEMS